jgi:hypothetical protein
LPEKLDHFVFQLLVVASFDEEVLLEVEAIGAAFREWKLCCGWVGKILDLSSRFTFL